MFFLDRLLGRERDFFLFCLMNGRTEDMGFQYFATSLSRKDRAAIGCAENGQPIKVIVHSYVRSDELLSYMQVNWKKSQFLMNTL